MVIGDHFSVVRIIPCVVSLDQHTRRGTRRPCTDGTPRHALAINFTLDWVLQGEYEGEAMTR